MRLLALTTAFLAPFCARALVDFTNNAFTGIKVGQGFNLTWKGDGTPVTITLMNGPTTNLGKVMDVATSAIGASYKWIPPTTLASGTYALSITQSGSTNYSPQFSIAAGTGAPASPSPSPGSPKTAVSSTSYPALSSYPPPTRGWASFTALAAMVSQAPFPAGSSSSSTIPSPRMSSTAVHTSNTGYLGNSTAFSGRTDKVGATGLALAIVAIGAGFAHMA